MLNIVIPMAGAGSRFAVAGYKDPKPLIPINGVPMIKLVIDNLRPSLDHKFIFICQKTHVLEYGLYPKLNAWAPGSEIIELDGLTEGAACTVLMAERFINNGSPLMIANSDQYIDFNIDAYLNFLNEPKVDGLIMTMTANDPKWSFVALDETKAVTNVVEKQVISNEATVGIYNFKKGADFVKAAKSMIDTNERVNGEFYVAPVYNKLISQGARILTCNIGSVDDGMYGLGTPGDLEKFLSMPISKLVTVKASA